MPLPQLTAPVQSALLPINCYPWGGTYRPAAFARCGLEDGRLRVLLWCEEDERDRPRYFKRNDPVSQDSCLEFFLNGWPELTGLYVNFEVNRAGTMLLEVGVDRWHRRFPQPGEIPGVDFPAVRAFEWEKGWGVELDIPEAFLQAICGVHAPLEPEKMQANFYKCGAVGDREHYACWAPVDTPEPDYHQPAFFRPFWRG